MTRRQAMSLLYRTIKTHYLLARLDEPEVMQHPATPSFSPAEGRFLQRLCAKALQETEFEIAPSQKH